MHEQPNIFLNCQEQVPGGNTTELLHCIFDTFEEAESERAEDLKQFLSITAGAMIFFMQTGFAMLCAGSVRIKNLQNTMLKNLLDACGAALAWFLVGEC
jgi:Amt family ammonium transporter